MPMKVLHWIALDDISMGDLAPDVEAANVIIAEGQIN